MLKPKQMSRLLIVASKDQMAPVITELYRHHLFHIEDFVESESEGYEGFRIGKPLPGASEASGNLLKIRAIENTFSVRGEETEVQGRRSQQEIRTRIERELPEIERQVEDLTGKRTKIDAQVKEFEQKISDITPFSGIPIDLELFRGYSEFDVFSGFVAHEVHLSVPNEMYFAKGKDKNFVIVITPKKHRGEAERALQEAGFQSVVIPEESGNSQSRIDFYSSRISALKKEEEEINQRIGELKHQQTDFLVACEEILKVEVEQTEAPLRFATTNETFVAEGWVPSESIATIIQDLEKVAAGKIFVTELPVDHEHDIIPVEYNNPPFAKPTQMLMDVYSRPKYSELDPTLMLSIVFPLFFGLILGDVGYGLILLAMCLGLRTVMKGGEGAQLLKVLRNASFSSIFFGLLYSEFLGFALPWSPIMFSRHLKIGAHATGHGPAIPELMILSVWIGVVHITLGRVLGIVNHARQDHGSHRIKAVLANAGWILVMWGILLMIWSMFAMPYMPDFTVLPKIIMGLSITSVTGALMMVTGVVLIARESALEIVELPSIISHVLSYARIVAVGLSSVAIAMVVNYISIGMLIDPQLENITITGVLFIIMGVFVFLIGHALNTALGILGGGLHSIRLHYVEFFTKFYKGGGKKYSPFGLNRRFTED